MTVQIDGAMDSFSVNSDITWLDLRLQIAERLVVAAADLNLGYKFTTDARSKAPNRLATHVQCIEMLQEAREGLVAQNELKGKGKKAAKPFKVEIVNLDAGKGKEKAKSGGKQRKHAKVDTVLNSPT
jgi:hypothetical protein